MANWDETIKASVWKKGRVVPLKSADEYRFDEQGALMKWSEYGKYTNEGWQIGHIYPEALLQKEGVDQKKIDAEINLRPVNSYNNDTKSDDYPHFESSVAYDSKAEKNVAKRGKWKVTEEVQLRLSDFFGLKSKKQE